MLALGRFFSRSAPGFFARMAILAAAVVLVAILVWGAVVGAAGGRPWGDRTAARVPWARARTAASRSFESLLLVAQGSDGGSGDADADRRRLVPHGLRGETRCRALLERWFGVPFPKVRPEWLRNPETKRRLELDCYNEQLRLAVEYDGAHHEVWTPHFQASPGALEAQKRRDRYKDARCRGLGITLIRVPFTEHAPDRLAPFLLRRLREEGFPVPGTDAVAVAAGSRADGRGDPVVPDGGLGALARAATAPVTDAEKGPTTDG